MDITTNAQEKKFNLTPASAKDFELAPVTAEAFLPENLGGVKPEYPGIDDNDTSRAGFWTNLGKKFSATIYDLGKGITEMPQWQEATQNTYVKGLTNAYLNRQVKKGNIDRAAADEFMGRYEDVVPKMGFMYPVQPGKETLGEKIAESGANKWLGGTAEQLRKEANRYDKGVTDYLKNKEWGKAFGAEVTGVVESMPYTIAAAFGGAIGAAGLGAVVGSQKYDEVKDREDMSDAMKLIDATSTAFWESFFEYIGTKQITDILKRRYATVAKDKVEDGIKRGITGFLEKAYKKFGVWFAPVHEGTSEFATQVAQNLTAKYTGEDPNRNPWDGAVDSFLIGMGMGTMSAAVEQGMEQIPKYYQRKMQRGQNTIIPPDPDQGVKDIINVYGERLKFNSNVPLAEDQNPLMSMVKHKIEDKIYFLTGESGKLGDHVFTGYDYDALKEAGYDFSQVTPKLIKASDIRERMDIPYNDWLQVEVDLYKQTQAQGQQLMTKAQAPVQEGQEITLGDKTFNVTFIDENGITLNEIDKNGNLTEGELIVPPEDYEKVFGVPAVDNGQSPQENVTEQGLQPQNVVTEQGQSTSVDNTLIPQLPVNKKGEIEYEKIVKPEDYAYGLTEEFGEDAPAILEDLIAEQEAALEKAKKTGNAIEKARKIKAISVELKKLQGVREILTPTATATQGNLDAQSASPVVEQPEPIEQATVQDVARPEEEPTEEELRANAEQAARRRKAKKERKRQIMEDLARDVPFKEALKNAGYIEVGGILFAPDVPQKIIDNIDGEILKYLLDHGITYVESSDTEGHGGALSFKDGNETYFGIDFSIGFLDYISKMSMDAFKEWVFDKEATQKPLAYKEVADEKQEPIETASKEVTPAQSQTEGDIVQPGTKGTEGGAGEKTKYQVDETTSEISPKSLKQLESENKSTAPKIPTNKVFLNEVEIPPREESSKVDDFFDTGDTDKLSVMEVNVRDIIPTQKNLTIRNLKETQGQTAGAILLKHNGKYYILDGHHRIANDILEGNETIEAYVYDTAIPVTKTPQPAPDFAGEALDNAPRVRVLTEFKKGDLVKNVQTKKEYEVVSITKVGKSFNVSLKEKGSNKISNFNGKRAQWVPVQKEVTLKVRKKPVPQEVLNEYPELKPKKDDIDKINDLFAEKPEKPPVEQPQGGQYKYKMSARPFDIGTYPKEGFVKAEDDPKGGFQILTYDRKLSEKERSHWSFLPLTEVDELKDKQFEDPDGEYFVDLEWMPNYSGADVSMFDSKNQLVEKPYFMSTNEILKNIESGYWKGKRETEKPKESPKSKTELFKQAEQILAEETTSRKLSAITDLIHKANDIDGLKSLLELDYVKKNIGLPKEVNSRIQYLERHPEKKETKAEEVVKQEEQSSLSPIQQKQIAKINKEYSEQIGKKQDAIAQAEKDMRDALLKADERNGLFGDTNPVEKDENNVSLLYENEEQYKKDQLDGYNSEDQRQTAVEEAVSQTEGRVLTSGLRSAGSLLQKILPRTVLKGFKESGYVNVIGQKVESPQDIADLWAIHRSPYIEKAHLIFVRDGKIVATTASTINRIGSSMFMKPQDVLRLYNKYKADGVYYLHNHPSGNHQTSLQDIITTNAHYMALERGGANLLGALVIDHNKFSYIDIKNNPIEDGDFYSSEEVEDYRKNRVQELEYKNPVSKLFHERESIQEGGQERMFEIARALLTENNYKGALVYVSSNLEISAYDVFPEGASAKDIIRLAKEGLKSNLGRSVVFIHDGSYGNELSINGQLPYDTLDVINTAKNESQWFSKEPRKGYANVVADKLWDEESEYKKSEFAGEYLEGKQNITQTPAFKKWFGNSKVVDENGKPLVVYHGSEDEKYIFEPFSHFGTEAAARERIKSITDKRGFIHPVYLSAANIIRVSDTGTNSPIDIAHEIGGIDLAIKSFRVYLENIPESELENVSLRAGFTDTATVDELVEEAIDRYNRLNKKSGDILDLLGDYREYIIKDAQDKAFFVASSYAKENGIDGIVYENEIEDPGSDSYIVFSPTQIKSATGNKGTFDPENPSILEEQQAPYQFAGDWLAKKPDPGPNPDLLKSAAQVYKEKEARREIPETIQGIREYIQDMNLPIRKFEEEVLKRGGKQDNSSKPYRDTSLSFGRQEKLYTDFFEQKMKPILRSISKMKKAGIPGEEVLPYVISKHAIERNAVMRGKELREWVDANQDATPDEIDAKREELKDKDYSGVMAFDTKKQYKNPDELAWDIVREFESRVDKSLIDELWSNVKTATQATLETWEAGNQLSPDQKKEYQEQYRYFVPLRGWRDDAAKELVYTRGEGFSNSLKKAEGRKSLADNPLAYILSVQFQAIAEQVDNEVKISMYNLIARNLNNPEINELATIKKLYNVKVKLPDGTEAWMETDARPAPELFASGDAKTKIYREHERLRKPRNAREHEVIVRKPGGDMIIVFKKKHLTTAQALNKQNYMFRAIWGGIYDARDMNKVMSMMGYFNNMLKALYTSWNVVFPFTNFMRDFQEAPITQSIKQGTGLKVMSNYRGAFPAVFRNLIGKPNLNNQLDRDLQDFYTLGGATGHTHTKTIEEIEKEVDREVDRLVREGTLTGSMKNGFRTTMRAIETWNKVFEDATRFSVYLSSIAAGNSKQDAAFDAKEAAVNFNRKGKGSKAWDSWFAFFNVAMQSLQKNFKLAKDHGGKFSAIAGSFIMMGFLEALMNAMTDDDEPDSSYYNINPYMRQNYLIIPNLPRLLTTGEKGNKYLSIPLPQFWRGFKSIGAIAFDIATRKMTVKDGIMDALGNFASGLLPVDVGGFWKSGEFSFAPIAPTIFKPGVEVLENRNYMGYTIKNEPFTRELKKSLANAGLGKNNVSPAAKYLTDMLFRWGGGKGKYKYYYDQEKGESHKVPGLLDINPSSIEHLFKGYTGGTGTGFSDLITTVVQATSPDQDIDFRNVPFLNRFIRKIPEDKWNIIGEYYDLRDDAKINSDLQKEAVKEAERTGDWSEVTAMYGNEYLQRYHETFRYYESELDDAMKMKDFDLVEGNRLSVEIMERAIQDIQRLKQEYGKK